jgi:chromosomal replication initiation ATPase DnaA
LSGIGARLVLSIDGWIKKKKNSYTMHTNTLLPETFRIRNLMSDIKRRPKIRDIKNTIYFYLRVDEEDADSKYRIRELVEARQFVHAICYKYKDKFNWTLKMIGRETGESHHSTIIHSKNIVKCHCGLEPDYKDKFDRIERIIKTRFNLDTNRN